MSDNNDSPFLSLLVGSGMVLMLLTPFYIARKFGAHVLSAMVAMILTALALNEGAIRQLAAEDVSYSRFSGPGPLLNSLLEVGLWKLAVIFWLMTVIILVAEHLLPQLKSGTGK